MDFNELKSFLGCFDRLIISLQAARNKMSATIEKMESGAASKEDIDALMEAIKKLDGATEKEVYFVNAITDKQC